MAHLRSRSLLAYRPTVCSCLPPRHRRWPVRRDETHQRVGSEHGGGRVDGGKQFSGKQRVSGTFATWNACWEVQRIP